MSKGQVRAILISDFNLDVFAGYLSNDSQFPKVLPLIAPFGQVVQVLMDETMECWDESQDLAIVWTRAEGVIDSFRKALDFDSVTIEEVFEEVDVYSNSLGRLANRVKTILVPTWTLPINMAGYGMLERKPSTGLSDLLARMNLRLAENLEKIAGAFVLDAGKWVQSAGQEASHPKLWYMGKIPFGNPVFKQAVIEIKSALTGLVGGAKKIIIVDLDDTLWGGIVGEDGWQNLKVGGHDSIGEAFADFQKGLKSLTRRGILLGIVSKNEEKVALEAIDNIPEMILKRQDFAGWRINWSDKAKNILDLMEELKLGIQSAVFIDDHPVERARIREVLPEVLVPDWPNDRMLYKHFLMSLNCFNTPAISREDGERTKIYQAESHRKQSKRELGSLNDWLKTLEMKVTVEGINKSNSQRASQLLNKTNQMNLTTRRMAESELLDWISEKNHHIWTFRALDKFGDSGLIGLISVDYDGTDIRVIDFLLSCRMMGRKVEEVMLHVASQYGRSLNLKTLTAFYSPTEKNLPCFTFLKESDFEHDKKTDAFIWNLGNPYPRPDCIEIIS